MSYKDLKALMADLKAVYAAVGRVSSPGRSGFLWGALGQEIPENLPVLAIQLGQSQHLLQVFPGGTAPDLHH